MHLNEWEDLKQFIDNRLSQTENSLRKEFRAGLQTLEKKMVKRMDEGFAGVAEVVETINERIDDLTAA